MSRSLGSVAEAFVCDYLQTQGLKLIARNFLCPWGELDLIMKEKNQIVFVEVRYRKYMRFGHPSETVTSSKRDKLIRTATYYLKKHNLIGVVPTRFDVVTLTASLRIENLCWIKDAFTSRC